MENVLQVNAYIGYHITDSFGLSVQYLISTIEI